MWLEACADHRVTITAAPSFALDVARSFAPSRSVDLSSIRALIVGAELVQPRALRSFECAFGDLGLSPSALCPAYGMAEVGVAATMVRPIDRWSSRRVSHPPDLGDGDAEVVSCGPPIDGIEVRIDAGSRIALRGASVIQRYVDGSAPHGNDGWLVTEDAGLLDGGELYPLGRLDDVVIVAGRNLSAVAIEAEIASVMAEAGTPARVAVVAWEGRYVLVAEVLRGAGTPSEHRRELRRTAQAASGFAPARVVVVPRGTIPRTPSGKLRRRELARMLHDGDIEEQ
jgi:acyl-CoA synthetase (AMP-forming)/AMP-acid ligase II